MTPGLAQSREQLPWLYYPESDRVIINAHNFTPPPSAPVGIGGEVFWLCPSLDDDGNGTTTLTDLSGNGLDATLVNMDAATDWVSDTDSGGIRAIDFDGTNDRLSITGVARNGSLSFSTWVKLSSFVSEMLFNFKSTNSVANFFIFSSALTLRGGSTTQFSSAAGLTLNTWMHLACTITGTTGTIFVNGTQTGTGTVTAVGATTSGFDLAAYSDFGAGYFLSGRMDDMRLFHRVLTGAEITALASQRGYQP